MVPAAQKRSEEALLDEYRTEINKKRRHLITKRAMVKIGPAHRPALKHAAP